MMKVNYQVIDLPRHLLDSYSSEGVSSFKDSFDDSGHNMLYVGSFNLSYETAGKAFEPRTCK